MQTKRQMSHFLFPQRNSPLSQLLFASERRGVKELRNKTGLEPKKFMEVAEYRSLSVTREQVGRLNSSGLQMRN